VNGLRQAIQLGGGYVHFPINDDGSDANGFGREFFEQLVESERRELVVERGLRHSRWCQIRDRTEALDLFTMCLVALEGLRADLDAIRQI
jgi:Phage terminase large subunit (GpA)